MTYQDEIRQGLFTNGTAVSLAIRCPHCGSNGIFPAMNDLHWHYARTAQSAGPIVSAGPRFCPNDKCRRLVFFLSRNQEVLLSYPNETLDFDATGVPLAVSGAMVEAVQCHAAGCYRASALMVRRTLEEICQERDAKGGNLKQRIESLGGLITIPRELLESLDQLRVLGNDAAHIEAKVYEQVGKHETEVAIAVAKEILKATYQYADLLEKLRSLGKQND